MAPGDPPLTFTAVEEALAWYDDERANVISATRLASAVGLDEVAWRLPTNAVPRVQPSEQLDGLRDGAPHGLEGASGRATGPARPGCLFRWASRWPGCGTKEAFDRLEQALAIRREVGDTRGRRRRHRAWRGTPQDARAG